MDFSAVLGNDTPKEIMSDLCRRSRKGRYEFEKQKLIAHIAQIYNLTSNAHSCHYDNTTEGSLHLYAVKLKGVSIKSKLIFWQQFKTHTLFDKNVFSKNVFRQITGGRKGQSLSVILLFTLCHAGKPLEKGLIEEHKTTLTMDLMLSVANLVFQQTEGRNDDVTRWPLRRREKTATPLSAGG